MSLRCRLSMALLAILGIACLPARSQAAVSDWQKGMTFPGWYLTYSDPNTLTSLNQLITKKVNYVTLIPDWVMSNGTSNTVYADTSNTPRDDTLRYIIQQIHSRGVKVMLKPHVDPLDGTWRGAIHPTDINAWFNSYHTFMMHYAQIAADTGVEQLCVGTEMNTVDTSAYTDRWRSLVADIRTVYKGALTYAANFDNYANVQFWDTMDYIGIDAYFPISREYTPTVDQVKAGWYSYTDQYGRVHRWIDDMKAVSQKWGKKILFTEVGYVNEPYAGWEHWALPGPYIPNLTAENNCVEGMFEVFDNEPWMVGAHWWWWNPDPNGGGPNDLGMWLNNKPAADIIASWYGKTTSTADTTAPTTPSGLTAQPSGTSQMSLTWTASTDNVGVAGYNIYRNGVKVATSTTTSYTDSGLAAGTTYTYRVSAVDAAGNESAQCTAVSAATATPGDTQAPTAPTGLTASATSSTQMALKWTASLDNVAVTGYNVYRDGTKITSVATTAYSDSGLTAGTTYQYQVAAYDAAGNTSALSAAVSGTTAAANTPSGYDFESGTQGWKTYQAATGLTSATAVKYQGSRSLGVTLQNASASNPGYIMVLPPSTLGAGKTITMQVYVASTANYVTAKAYVQDLTYNWAASGALMTLKANGWTQIAVTVPATAALPLNNIGIQFMTNNGRAFSGTVYVDDVRWDGAASNEPTTPTTPTTTAKYGFEDGTTQNWKVYQATTNVWSANYLHYEGNDSLGAWLENVSDYNPGYLMVTPDATLTAGRTVTMQVYLDTTATNVAAKAYVQDASYNWVAVGQTSLLKAKGWTQLSVTVPATAQLPLNNIGIQFTASGGAVKSSVYVDNVSW